MRCNGQNRQIEAGSRVVRHWFASSIIDRAGLQTQFAPRDGSDGYNSILLDVRVTEPDPDFGVGDHDMALGPDTRPSSSFWNELGRPFAPDLQKRVASQV